MSEAHTTRKHARLAPSAAHRWLNCSGSVWLEATMPDAPSSYANEGTAAHTLCAFCLEQDENAATYLGAVVDIERGDFWFSTPENPIEPNGLTRFEITDEMVEAVQTYLDHFGVLYNETSGPVEWVVEQRLDMTHLHPEIFGTGDAVVYQHNTGLLHVVDFKYGKGVAVSPVENPQLMLYGAGAARRYAGKPINGITLHIVQPRAAGEPVKSWETDLLTLVEFEEEIREKARNTELPDAPLAAGEWCRFCKAAAVCPTLRAESTRRALVEFSDAGTTTEIRLPDLSLLGPVQLAAILADAEMIGNWVAAVQAYAHAEAIAGRVVPGFKLVAKRSIRRWRDEAEAQAALEMLAVEPFAEPKMKSPAMVEKAVGKKDFAVFEGMVTKVSSGMNLAPVADARAAVKSEGLIDFKEIV